jgi:cytochrome P450
MSLTSKQYETLRLYGPVTWVPRETARDAEIVSLGNTGSKASIVIPRNTDLHLNMYARQVSTNIWGPDALQFRPDRFILSVDQPVPKDWVEHGNVSDGKEKLVAPPLPYFSPWLSGPRICPGMKFSQVSTQANHTLI